MIFYDKIDLRFKNEFLLARDMQPVANDSKLYTSKLVKISG